MKTALASVAIAALLMSLGRVAAVTPADARVMFAKSAEFIEESTDSLIRDESVQRLRAALEEELRLRAPECLAQGQLITLYLTEVNSAGAVRPARGTTRSDVRVVKDAWVIALRFNYRLLDAEQEVLDEGSKDLRNSGFVGGSPTERNAASAYPNERALVSGWFKSRYCARDKSKPK